MKKLHLVFILGFIWVQSFSQNLPPGSIPKPKSTPFQLETKLNDIYKSSGKGEIKAVFIKNLNGEELSAVFSGIELEYYQKAMAFYTKLSKKVKVTLSTDELWDVYFYDEEGTKKLLSIN